MNELFLYDESDDLSIDLTPLVDVIFMLIIFFVTAAAFIKPAIEVDLARAESAQNGAASGRQLVITIDKAGEIYLDGTLTTPPDLGPVLDRERRCAVNLFVDRKAPFDAFLSVIDLSRRFNRHDLVVTVEHADD